MIIRLLTNTSTVNVTPQVARVIRVYNHRVPSGIQESEFTEQGGILVGTGDGTYLELPLGSEGQSLVVSPGEVAGVKWDTPSLTVEDTKNFLINGGFEFTQRQTPGTLTTKTDNTYSADRWKVTRENADIQYQRNDATSESGLTSLTYGRFKKITNNGKIMVAQIIESANSVPLRGKTVVFQIKMKASAAYTIRMGIFELNTSGTIDTIPNPLVTSWGFAGTDPTMGTNVAIITAAQSKSVTTSWQNFTVSVTVPATSKNIICAIWSNGNVTANDTIDIAEAGLFIGTSAQAWLPQPYGRELLLCQRYYEKSTAIGTVPTNGSAPMRTTGGAYTTSIIQVAFIQFATPKRTSAPTITPYRSSDGATSGVWSYYSGGWLDATSVTITALQAGFYIILNKTTSFTLLGAYAISGVWTAEDEL